MAVQLGTSIHASDRVTTAHAAAGATATPATPLDLGPQRGRNQPFLKLQVTAPAVPDLEDDKTIIFALTSCATSGGSYTAVSGYSALITQTGAGGAGAAAASIILPVPEACLQYVKVTAAVLTAGGDNTGVSYIMETVLDHHG